MVTHLNTLRLFVTLSTDSRIGQNFWLKRDVQYFQPKLGDGEIVWRPPSRTRLYTYVCILITEEHHFFMINYKPAPALYTVPERSSRDK